MARRYVDVIEAEAAIKGLFADMPRIEFMGNRRRWREENEQYLRCLEVLRSLPTADGLPSAQRWIPASERLPENDDWVIVTILDESGDTPFRYSDFGWYLEEANCWIVDAQQRRDVVAWEPLPEPYKEEKNDAEAH